MVFVVCLGLSFWALSNRLVDEQKVNTNLNSTLKTESQAHSKALQGLTKQKTDIESSLKQEQQQGAQKQQEIESLRSQLQAKREATVTLAKAATVVPGNCEAYRTLIAQYAWPVESAMLVMSKESGCDPNAVSSTNDHGLFQLNNQAIYDPASNIAVAYSKYVSARRGNNNWSAWYAVCTPSQVPKYAGISCA